MMIPIKFFTLLIFLLTSQKLLLTACLSICIICISLFLIYLQFTWFTVTKKILGGTLSNALIEKWTERNKSYNLILNPCAICVISLYVHLPIILLSSCCNRSELVVPYSLIENRLFTLFNIFIIYNAILTKYIECSTLKAKFISMSANTL